MGGPQRVSVRRHGRYARRCHRGSGSRPDRGPAEKFGGSEEVRARSWGFCGAMGKAGDGESMRVRDRHKWVRDSHR